MNLILLLFLVGILLLAFEVIVPGGILGAIGALALLAGVVLSFVDFGALGGILSLLAAGLLVLVMVLVEFVLLPRTAIGRRLFLHAAIGGVSQPPPADAAAIVGAVGTTVTTLAPTGYVEVNGRRYEGFSRSGLLQSGTPVRVEEVDNFRLIVTKTQ